MKRISVVYHPVDCNTPGDPIYLNNLHESHPTIKMYLRKGFTLEPPETPPEIEEDTNFLEVEFSDTDRELINLQSIAKNRELTYAEFTKMNELIDSKIKTEEQPIPDATYDFIDSYLLDTYNDIKSVFRVLGADANKAKYAWRKVKTLDSYTDKKKAVIDYVEKVMMEQHIED